MQLVSGKSGTKASDTKTLSSQLLVSDTDWLLHGEGTAPSPTRAESFPPAENIPGKDTHMSGWGHVIAIGPLMVARSL